MLAEVGVCVLAELQEVGYKVQGLADIVARVTMQVYRD
jgi:hypothetical protein